MYRGRNRDGTTKPLRREPDKPQLDRAGDDHKRQRELVVRQPLMRRARREKVEEHARREADGGVSDRHDEGDRTGGCEGGQKQRIQHTTYCGGGNRTLPKATGAADPTMDNAALGCDQYQGFLHCAAVAPADVVAMLKPRGAAALETVGAENWAESTYPKLARRASKI